MITLDAYKPTWCPGCGNFAIWYAVKKAIGELNIELDQLVITYGIGCHGHMVNYLATQGFEGLHGRPLPVAEGVRLVRPDLIVIASTGDGDCLSEGTNHFVHLCRRNIDLTVLIHDNQVYGLTTGQTSPTSERDYRSKSTPKGNLEEPLNPLRLALVSGATFVARTYSGDLAHLTQILKAGIQHKGTSIIDVLQPCVTFNKLNTYEYFQKRVYKVVQPAPTSYEALKICSEWGGRIPLGIFWQVEKPTYEDQIQLDIAPLDQERLARLLATFS